MLLRTAGQLHIFFFIVIIFVGSFYILNVVLGIVAMSYDEFLRCEEEAAARYLMKSKEAGAELCQAQILLI